VRHLTAILESQLVSLIRRSPEILGLRATPGRFLVADSELTLVPPRFPFGSLRQLPEIGSLAAVLRREMPGLVLRHETWHETWVDVPIRSARTLGHAARATGQE